MEALQDTLRRQCSFHEISIWLVENTPITGAEFNRIKRIENIPMNGDGEVLDAWYARDSKILKCGWMADLRWSVDPDYIWSARNLVEALGMFVLTPLTISDRRKGLVTAQQRVTVLADNFPAMWLAQKLTGKVD